MARQALAELLTDAERAIQNGLNEPEIAAKLAEFGYTAERIQEGQALYETALQLYQEQKARYGDQFGATDAFYAKWEEARTPYMRHVAVARVAFKNDRDAWHKLGLEGRRPEAFASWLQLAERFYTYALGDADIAARLAEFGLTTEKLQAVKTMVDEVEALEQGQEGRRGEAQETTRRRDEAIDALQGWLSDYLAIARIALAETPQLAEKLGILVRSA